MLRQSTDVSVAADPSDKKEDHLSTPKLEDFGLSRDVMAKYHTKLVASSHVYAPPKTQLSDALCSDRYGLCLLNHFMFSWFPF